MPVNSVNERIKNLGMLVAFYERAGTMKSIPSDKSIPLMLGIFAFILSKMLNGELGCTLDEITEHVHKYYTLENWVPDKDLLSRLIMRMMYKDRESGIPFRYFDFETKKATTVKYVFLKVEHSSSENSGNRISLTKMGRDMLFQTREIYQELRITMDLLFIKEQFKRGAFSRAIRSAESLKSSVQDSLEAKERLLFEIKRAPWRVKAESLGESYEDIKQQFIKEKEQFDELITLINNTDYREIEDKNASSLVRLESVLNQSRLLHEKLFTLHLSILPEYMTFRNKSTLRLLLGDINFSSDLIDPLFQADNENINPDTLFFLPSPDTKQFFPWLSISRNPLKGERRLKQKLIVQKVVVDEQNLKIEAKLKKDRIEFLNFILRVLKESKQVLLSDVLNYFPPDDNILALIISLHQHSKILFSRSKNPDVTQSVKHTEPSFKGIKVYTLKKVLKKDNYHFSEYVFERI